VVDAVAVGAVGTGHLNVAGSVGPVAVEVARISLGGHGAHSEQKSLKETQSINFFTVFINPVSKYE
jgi:hypothetical protein